MTTFTFDRDHLTSKTEGAGTGRERTTSYSYLSVTSARPTDVQLSTPGSGEIKDVATSYNSQNLPISETQTGYTSGTATVSRSTGKTYYSNGQLETAIGPRTDVSQVTTYTYNSCTTGSGCGQIHTVTDPASHVTTYNTYNALGLPLTITDPNGVVTTMTYDARGRLTSRAVGSETTSFMYYPTGLLETVTLPDSSTLQYTYDSAHRLTQIADGAGNSIVYTLDAMGNRTAESAYDPSSVLSRTRTRVFNTLNQLYQEVGAAGTSAVTTTYSYDVAGNQTTVAAPLSRTTVNGYDELHRLNQITDPASGNTAFTYDANDNLASVQDPRSLTTSYSHDGLGDLTQTVSPDTGTTTMTYDSGGNLSTSTDARSEVASFSYDVLNRTTLAGYSDQTIDYTYDSGTNGVGHLTGASDSNHSMSWQYDGHGRVTSKSQTVGSITETVGYDYTSGQLVSITTPSGQTIAYTYSNHRISAIAVNGSSLLSSVQYEPFGPVRGWTWSNSTSEVRLHDTDGNPSAISALESTSYTVDNAFRITAIANASSSALSWAYGFDSLDRLTSASQTGNSQSWTYDANGNRLTQGGTSSSTYTISSSNNQISAISGALSRSYSYDSAGNTTSNSAGSFTYNDRGRMSSATASGSTTNYLYNALGQRIEKSGGPAGTVLFMYDEAGHLVGEYDSSGSLIEETVWMDDVPVATLRPSGSTVAVYYVHADHLNAPRMVTRPSDNGILWRWDSDPFGSVAPNQNPQSLGTFVYNLRFPGQYYDSETGLNYNYHRDYDPQIGRYVESDPIGLDGGTYSTYSYVGGNPIGLSDPTGLWIPPIHKKMATASANEAGCSNIASQIGVATAHVDALPTSQDPSNSFWHAMSDGTAGQSANEAMQLYDTYVAKYSSSCKIDDLARALHAVEDSFSPAHEGFQAWMGFSNTSYFALAIHGLKDTFPTPSAYGAAVQAGADIMSQAASRCPCLCRR